MKIDEMSPRFVVMTVLTAEYGTVFIPAVWRAMHISPIWDAEICFSQSAAEHWIWMNIDRLMADYSSVASPSKLSKETPTQSDPR